MFYNISKNLKLAYGYYAVRNRSSDEVNVMNVKDGYALENKFFNVYNLFFEISILHYAHTTCL